MFKARSFNGIDWPLFRACRVAGGRRARCQCVRIALVVRLIHECPCIYMGSRRGREAALLARRRRRKRASPRPCSIPGERASRSSRSAASSSRARAGSRRRSLAPRLCRSRRSGATFAGRTSQGKSSAGFLLHWPLLRFLIYKCRFYFLFSSPH